MSTPQPPTPEYLTLVEEHLAPALSSGAYARHGLRAAVASWRILPLRVARFVVALPQTLVVPVVLAGVLAHARGFDLGAWLHGAAPPVSRDAVVSAMPVVTALSALLGHVLLKATLDAAILAGLRGVVCPRRPLNARQVLRLYPGSLGLVLLELGLLVGSVLFLSPSLTAVLGVLGGSAEQPEGAGLFAVLVLLPGVSLVGLGRFWVGVAAAFLAWRPRFVAATLVSAVWMPVRRWRSFAPLLGAYAVVYLAFVATGALLLEGEIFSVSTVGAGTWFVLVLAQLALALWSDATLVGLVGQQLGDIEPDASGAGWRRPDPAMAAPVRLPPPFEPRLPGAYVVEPGVSGVVSFGDVVRLPSRPHSEATPAAVDSTGRA